MEAIPAEALKTNIFAGVGKKKKPVKAKKPKAKRPAKKKTVKRKPAKSDKVVRGERLDMRLSKAEKAKLMAKAKKTKRTVTSIVLEAIQKIR